MSRPPGTGPLRFGIVLTPAHGTETPASVQIAEHREAVTLARDLGFELLITGQHFASPELRFLQPVPYLAALSELAHPMRLVLGVLLLPLLHPLRVAEEVATLDAVSGGRAVMGAGIGYSQKEFDVFGVDRTRRASRMEEAVAVIRALWEGGPVTHRGAHFDLDGVASSVLPVSDDGIPVWVGASADASVSRAARIGDAWYIPPFPSHRRLVELHDVHSQIRLLAGLPAPTDFPVRREVFVGDSRDDARLLAEMATRSRYRTYADWGLTLGDDEGVDWWSSRFVLGDDYEVADRLIDLIEAVPMSHLVLRAHWPGWSHLAAMRHLERIGARVLPSVGAHVNARST